MRYDNYPVFRETVDDPAFRRRVALPSFIRHYRTLGVTRFIVVDDQSSDETRDVLTAHVDVDLWASPALDGEGPCKDARTLANSSTGPQRREERRLHRPAAHGSALRWSHGRLPDRNRPDLGGQ